MGEVWQDGQSEPVVRELLKRVLNEFRVTLAHLRQTPKQLASIGQHAAMAAYAHSRSGNSSTDHSGQGIAGR